MKQISEIKASYIAGFVDGEGCITLIKHQDKRVDKGYTLYPKVQITNTNKRVILNIKKLIGGRVESRSNGNKSKRVYDLMFSDLESILRLLTKIYPYLLVKRKQAELMIRYCNSRINNKSSNYSFKEVGLVNKFRKLNSRGQEAGILANFI